MTEFGIDAFSELIRKYMFEHLCFAVNAVPGNA